MRSILIILALLLSFTSAKAQNLFLEYVNSAGGLSLDEALAVTADHQGNSYLTGRFSGTADFNPTGIQTNLSSNGSTDIFIIKLSAAGNLLWAKSIGGNAADQGNDILVNNLGEVYVTGSFRGTVDFNPGIGSFLLQSQGVNNAFILKLDPNGNFIWARAITSNGDSKGNSLSQASGNRINLAGSFTNLTDFSLDGTGFYENSNGSEDAFIIRIKANGDRDRHKVFGGTSVDRITAISTLSNQHTYLTGSFSDVVDFNPGFGVNELTADGDQDGFILSLDSNLNHRFAFKFGGIDLDQATDINLDSQGDIYVSGYFSGSADFDPTSNSAILISNGGQDGFLAKYSSQGNFIYANKVGNSGADICYSIATDSQDNIYAFGTFSGQVDFDPSGASHLVNATNTSTYIWRLNAQGSFVDVGILGNSGNTYGLKLNIINEKLYASGWFLGTADFDPTANTQNITSAGSSDAFNLKMTICNPVATSQNIHACDSYTDRNGTIYAIAGNYTIVDSLMSACGNDSIVTTFLNLTNSFAFLDTVQVCQGAVYTFPDGTSAVNLISDTLQTSSLSTQAGCDSTIQTQILVEPGYSLLVQASKCFGGSYTFPDGSQITNITSDTVQVSSFPSSFNCDSNIVTQLTVDPVYQLQVNASVCNGGSYTFPNGQVRNNITSALSQTSFLTSSKGCDSTITTNISIQNPMQVTVRDTVCKGASYTFPDGTVYSNIQSATNQTSFLSSQLGCDSIVVTKLHADTINTHVIGSLFEGYSFESGATYQWYNCDQDTLLIVGADSQQFTIDINGWGYYLVEITKYGCTRRSECVYIGYMGIEEAFADVSIYPNPVADVLNIDIQKGGAFIYRIIDITGAIRASGQLGSGASRLELNLPAGMYHLELSDGSRRSSHRFIKL